MKSMIYSMHLEKSSVRLDNVYELSKHPVNVYSHGKQVSRRLNLYI